MGIGHYAYRIPIDEDFTLDAKIFLGDDTQADGGGYGLTFLLHNEESLDEAFGLGGPALGVGSNTLNDNVISRGLAVEFDTHLDYTSTKANVSTDNGQDYDIYKNHIEPSLDDYDPPKSAEEIHLFHTAVQALGDASSSQYDAKDGLGDYYNAKGEDWHRAESIITIEDADPNTLFGEWLDIRIEWKVDEGTGEHILSYYLWDSTVDDIDKEAPLATSSVVIEDEFHPNSRYKGREDDPVNVIQSLLYNDEIWQEDIEDEKVEEVKYVYWGFSASNAFVKDGRLLNSDDANEQAIALTKLPSEADAYATKMVRKVEEGETETTKTEFSGSTMVEVGDTVEYEIEIKLDDETAIPLTLASYYDSLESGHEMLIDTLEIEKTRKGTSDQYYSIADGTITEGDESDDGSITYYESDGQTVDRDPAVITPRYLFDEDTGEFQVYRLGTLGAYDDSKVNESGLAYDDEEKIVIRFQAEVTSAGIHDEVIYNKGYVQARTISEFIYTNDHLLTEDGTKLDEDKLKEYGLEGIDLTDNGETKIYVLPDISMEKSVAELTDPEHIFYEGDDVTYVLTASNSGGTWTNGTLTDTLPDGFEFDDTVSDHVTVKYYQKVEDGSDQEIALTSKPTVAWEYKDGEIIISNLELGFDEYVVVELKGTIAANAAGSQLKNTAEAGGESKAFPDAVLPDVTDSAELDVSYRPGILDIAKEATSYFRDGQDHDIVVENAGDDKKLRVGDEVTYEVVLTNDSENNTGSLVRNAVITDKLPAEVSYVAGSAAVSVKDKDGNDKIETAADGSTKTYTATYDSAEHKITTDPADLYDDEQIVLTYKVLIENEATGALVNTASGEGDDPYSDADEDKISTEDVEEKIVVPPDITVEKSDGTASGAVYSGDSISYKLTVSNADGGGKWTGKLVDTISADLAGWTADGTLSYQLTYYDDEDQIVTDKSIENGTATVDKGAFTIDGITLYSGWTVIIEYTINVGDLPEGVSNYTVDNEVGVYLDDALLDEDDTRTHVVLKPGSLGIKKDVFPYDEANSAAGTTSIDGESVKVGETLLYEITVTNSGDADTVVNNITISDVLPEGVTFTGGFTVNGTELTESDSGRYTYVEETATLTYTHGSLRGGESIVITFLVSVNGDASGMLTNVANATATVPKEAQDPDADPKEEEDIESDDAKAENSAAPDVTIEKTVDETAAYIGEEFTYTITLTNQSGAGKWTGQLTDSIPDNTSYVSSTITYVDAEGKETVIDPLENTNWDTEKKNFTDDAITLRAGESYVLTITVRAEAAGTAQNTAYATGKDGDGEDSLPAAKDENLEPGFSEMVETKVGVIPGTLAIEKLVADESGNDIGETVIEKNTSLFYTVRVYNAHAEAGEDSELSNIVITDTLPDNVNYDAISTSDIKVTDDNGNDLVKDTDYSITLTDREFVITLADDYILGTGESIYCEVGLKADKRNGDPIVNRARATADAPADVKDDTSVAETQSARARVRNYYGPEITLDKVVQELEEDGNATFYESDTVTYTLKISNQGGTWTDGKLIDKLPAGFVFDDMTAGSWTANYYKFVAGGADQPITTKPVPALANTAGVVMLTGLELEHGEYVLVELKGSLAAGTAGETLYNKARAEGVSLHDPDFTSEDTADASLKVNYNAGSLGITKEAVTYTRGDAGDVTVPADRILQVGDRVTYEVTVSNLNGNGSIVNDVIITDTLPQDVKYLYGSAQAADAVVVTENDGVITTAPVSLGDGESITLTYTVEVQNTAAGELTNTASAAGTVPPDNDKVKTNSVEEIIIIAPLISVSKDDGTDGAGVVFSGEDITYTLIVSNAEGGGQWEGQITDTISSDPDGWPADGTEIAYKMSVYENDADQDPEETIGTVTIEGGTFTIGPGVLQSGQRVVITYTIKLNLPQDVSSVELINRVKVTDNSGEKEYGEDETSTYVVPDKGELDVKKEVFDSAGDSVADKNVVVGDTLTYKITVSNTADAGTIINDVVFSDSLPAGVTYVIDSFAVDGSTPTVGFMYDKDSDGVETLTYEYGALRGQQSFVITFGVTVDSDASGSIINTAAASGTVPEEPEIPNPGQENPDNQMEEKADDTVESAADPDVSITKTVSTQAAYVGEEITYTITLANAEGAGRYSGTLTDEIPEHLEVRSITGGIGGASDDLMEYLTENLLTMDVELHGGEEYVIVIKTIAISATSGSVKNIAVVTDEDGNTDQGESEETVINEHADSEISVTKAVSHNQVEVGEEFTYTIEVTNTGGTWSGSLSDLLPAGAEYVSHDAEASGSVTITHRYDDDELIVEIDNLEDGDKVLITFVVKATDEKLGLETGIRNSAVVSGMDEAGNLQSRRSNEVKTLVVHGTGALDVTKSVYSTEAAYPYGTEAEEYNLDGKQVRTTDTLRYVIRISNTVEYGRVELTDYIFTDELSEYLNYVAGSFTVNGASVNPTEDGQKLSYELDGMVVTDDELIIAFDVTVSAEADGSITNVAAVEKESDRTDSNAISNYTDYELSLDKHVDNYQEAILTGEELTYVITLANAEGASAYTGTLTDVIPAELKVERITMQKTGDADPTDITDQADGNSLTLDVSLRGGEELVIIIYTTAIEANEAGIINTAVVKDQDDIVEEDDSEKTTIHDNAEPSVTLSKEVDPEVAPPGETVQYVITIDNTGIGTWYGEILDEMPDELENFDIVSVETQGDAKYGFAGFGVGSKAENILSVDEIVLGRGEAVIITVTADIKESVKLGTVITNVVTAEGVDQQGDRHDPEDADAEAVVLVKYREGELDVEKEIASINEDSEIDPETTRVEPGDIIEYTIRIGNDGEPGSRLRDLLIVDTLPDGVVLLDRAIAVQDADGNDLAEAQIDIDEPVITIELEGRELEAGEYIYITMYTLVTSVAEELLENVVDVEAEAYDPADPEAGNVLSLRASSDAKVLVNEIPDPDVKGTYTVRYYYDGVLDAARTETYTADLGTTITGFTDKIRDGYYLDSVTGIPLTVSKDDSQNIIRVYYVSLPAAVYEYRIEYYYDEVLDQSRTITGSGTAGEAIDSYVPQLVSGYVLDRTEGLLLTISAAGENVIRIYYVAEPEDKTVIVDYTIEYYYDNIRNDAYTVTGSGAAGEIIDSYVPRLEDGYQFSQTENLPLTLTEGGENVIRVYYETISDNFCEYTIEYYFDGVRDASLTEVATAREGSVINYYLDKIKTGYLFERTEGLPLTVTAGGNNVIRVYYRSVPDEPEDLVNYYIVYYYDDIPDTELTEVIAAEIGTIITDYVDKPKDGFEFKEVLNLPLTVDADESNNIIEVFYESEEQVVPVKDPDPDSDPKPTGEVTETAIDPENKNKSNVQTGDYNRIAGYVIVLMLTLGIAYIAKRRRRNIAG